jgi:ribosome hibernation promoting factor
MNISITARRFKAHETLKDYIRDEISSLNKFNEDILTAEVILSFQNTKESVKTAEINLSIPGHTITVKEDSDDFKKSVGAATEKLARQLKKIKTKKIVRVK